MELSVLLSDVILLFDMQSGDTLKLAITVKFLN